ncbi:PrgI family protein [Actinomadura oligospora]|uniref:PrgI family protein n=1 Tax=Actinomadura oligospora TaxID=111804 RepID=UPI00047CDB23|nr:PrgI family protein [Actinomadura oligospora]
MHDDTRVLIPADLEREDRLLWGLTARQLAILSVTAVTSYLVYGVASRVTPQTVALACVVPLVTVGAALALFRRDGVGLDQLVVAAWRQSRMPRRQVFAPEGVPGPAELGPRLDEPLPGVLNLPVRSVRRDGVLDLGGDGVAVIVDCSTISFALRTDEEQLALVAAFGRWLNSLTHPVQVVVVAERVNLRPAIVRLRADAPALPHPALERGALEHAAFLERLGASRDLLRRRVLLVLREPHDAPGGRDVAGAAGRVLRRAEDAAHALGAAQVTARVLDAAQAAAVLAGCLDPGMPPGLTDLAAPNEPVTAARLFKEDQL